MSYRLRANGHAVSITLGPAYGRDYKSAAAVKADWAENRDFIIRDYFHPSDGKPTSREDWIGKTVAIRYAKLTRIVLIKG